MVFVRYYFIKDICGWLFFLLVFVILGGGCWWLIVISYVLSFVKFYVFYVVVRVGFVSL